MKKAKFLFILIWLILAFVYIMDGSYEMGFVLVCYLFIHSINSVLCVLSGRDLVMCFQLPYSVEKEGIGRGILKIENQSLFPVAKGNAQIRYENRMTGESGRITLPFTVLPKGKTEARFDFVSEYCGECRFWIEKVQVFDMFGVFSGKRTQTGQGTCLIFPKTEEVAIQINERDAYDMESFRYSDVIKGDDPSETFAIREYMAGDSMRRIHWKLTGKLGQVMVKEPSFPVFNSMMLILETGYEKEFPEPEKMNACVEVCLSIGEMLCRQETPFELGYYNYEKEFFYSQRVEHIEEIWTLVPGILKAGRKQAANSAYYQYQLNAGDRRFAHYMYVAADASFPDVELAAETEAITIIRCGEQPGRDGNRLTYSYDNWKEELL